VNDSRLFDPGLQPERTAMAWQRTALALVVGSAASLRMLPPVFGAWSLAIGVAGLVTSAALWMAARARAQRVLRALLIDRAPLPGGLLLAAFSATTAAAAALSLGYVLAR
jgi:putative membrane protein